MEAYTIHKILGAGADPLIVGKADLGPQVFRVEQHDYGDHLRAIGDSVDEVANSIGDLKEELENTTNCLEGVEHITPSIEAFEKSLVNKLDEIKAAIIMSYSQPILEQAPRKVDLSVASVETAGDMGIGDICVGLSDLSSTIDEAVKLIRNDLMSAEKEPGFAHLDERLRVLAKIQLAQASAICFVASLLGVLSILGILALAR